MHIEPGLCKCTDDWKADGYRWRNNGTKKLPEKAPRFTKMYLNITTPEGTSKSFQKEVFQPRDGQLIIIHYLGDETVAVDYPHGNAKTLTTAHQMTAPSVLHSLKMMDGTASAIYKKKGATGHHTRPGHAMLLPKNMKQIYNAQYCTRQKMRMTRDALYNLHEMAYDAPHVIRRIATFPNLQVICMDSRMTEELNKLLHTESPRNQMMTYNTTFQLGDFSMFHHFSFATRCWMGHLSCH